MYVCTYTAHFLFVHTPPICTCNTHLYVHTSPICTYTPYMYIHPLYVHNHTLYVPVHTLLCVHTHSPNVSTMHTLCTYTCRHSVSTWCNFCTDCVIVLMYHTTRTWEQVHTYVLCLYTLLHVHHTRCHHLSSCYHMNAQLRTSPTHPHPTPRMCFTYLRRCQLWSHRYAYWTAKNCYIRS